MSYPPFFDQVERLRRIELRHHHHRRAVDEIEQRVATDRGVIMRAGQQVRAAPIEPHTATEAAEQLEVGGDRRREITLDTLRSTGRATRVVHAAARRAARGKRVR